MLSLNNSTKLIAYPNGAPVYNPSTKEWSNDQHGDYIFSRDSLKWYKKGCFLIGGCCCTTKEDIIILAKTLSTLN